MVTFIKHCCALLKKEKYQIHAFIEKESKCDIYINVNSRLSGGKEMKRKEVLIFHFGFLKQSLTM